MNINIRNIDLEMSLILARIYKHIRIKSGMSTDILDTNFSKLDMTFYPLLALLAAQGPKGITKKNRTLAVASQIIYLSTEIHNQIPEDCSDNYFTKQVQLPILVGDLLYSRFYEVLCAEDCIEFLDYYVDYISNLNIKWVDYLQNKISIEDINISWYGEFASLILMLNANVSGFNNYWIKIIKRYGFGLGGLLGVYKLNLNNSEAIKFWSIVQEAINLMPPGDIKDNFNLFAQDLYKNLFKNIIQEDIFLSVAAEN
ncbi:MAG: hypothetical protein ACOYJ1_09925 [Peptococcales bacterium]|jgi:hypothetical protein